MLLAGLGGIILTLGTLAVFSRECHLCLSASFSSISRPEKEFPTPANGFAAAVAFFQFGGWGETFTRLGKAEAEQPGFWGSSISKCGWEGPPLEPRRGGCRFRPSTPENQGGLFSVVHLQVSVLISMSRKQPARKS